MNLDSITDDNYQAFYQFVRSQKTNSNLINFKTHLSHLLHIYWEDHIERTLVLREKIYLVNQQIILNNRPEVVLNIPENIPDPSERPSSSRINTED